MAYNENIPKAPDKPSQSQGQILANFSEISTAFNLNHGNFNDPDQGEHTLIDLARQTLPQSANANEGLLFGALINGASELFYGKDSSQAVQMSGIIPTTGGGSATSFSWDFVSGMSIRFGSVVHTGTSTVITFDTAFANNAYVVLSSPQGSAALLSGNNVQGLNLNGFTLASVDSSTGVSFYYIALGR